MSVFKALGLAVSQLTHGPVLKVLLKSVAITVGVFILFGALLYWGLVEVFAAYGLEGGGFVGAAAAVLVAGLSFWFLFRLVALAVLQFFADEIVVAVEARHYPEAARMARKLPFRRDLANSVKGIGRTVALNLLALPVAVALVVTGIGSAAVFLVVNAWLLGRELTDMAWLRHCGSEPAENPVSWQKRALLGAAVAVIMLIPFANLLAPVIGAAAGTHLTQSALSLRDEKALHLHGQRDA
ncbi:EI24 domain-containing protein [Erythrobacter sp. NAP1]|uniref:EI24 domain-containing protein n=1 Tax=Erythrobacter sp. NAP1 TaxID=237727 RepID=UPI001F51A725|nr:EI24 domain-containing protein [Erythrobacter sp. NAP1]